ncbi:MAG: amidohydrolase [Phycisphaerae bacterium]|nr:amidohydrolase [Phycisphaerae bacterium]MCZ2401540.1 amidohydrolase [Phycisphaerae bacterium]
MTPDNDLMSAAAAAHEQLRAVRRHLHANPELSGCERETAAYVAAQLRRLGYEPVTGVGGTHGVTAELAGPPGPCVALRADMDALPISEETGLPFASTRPGVMHACGHDAHTAMLLGAAQLLRQRQGELRRPVRFIFQPHEERFPGGAVPLIAAGVLENVASIFGLHISSQLPLGVLGTRPGPFMAGLNDLDIRVIGKGGHAAMPEQCVDPIVTAAQIVLALQSVVSRSLAMTDLAVVSVTRIEAGTADNVIPQDVRMRGTIRTYDPGVQARVCARVREIATGVAAAHGAAVDVRLDPGYPVLVNNPEVTRRACEIAAAIGFDSAKIQTIEPQGGGEDFAYYCQKAPGAFAFLGARVAGDAYPHHHPRFDVDEAALPLGAALLAAYALHAA